MGVLDNIYYFLLSKPLIALFYFVHYPQVFLPGRACINDVTIEIRGCDPFILEPTYRTGYQPSFFSICSSPSYSNVSLSPREKHTNFSIVIALSHDRYIHPIQMVVFLLQTKPVSPAENLSVILDLHRYLTRNLLHSRTSRLA